MAEVFGTAAAALGLAATAVDSILKLKAFVDNLAAAPDNVKNISTDLTTIGLSLKSLADLSQDDNTSPVVKGVLRTAGVDAAVESCGKAAQEFQAKLAGWTKHSTADHMHWWDRFKTGTWQLDTINTFVRRIECLKASVIMTVGTTMELIQFDIWNAAVASEAQRDRIELTLQQQAETIKAQFDEIKKLLEERKERKDALAKVVTQAAADDDEAKEFQATKSRDQVLEEVQVIEEQEVNCLALLKRVQSARSSLSIGKVETVGYSQAIVGIPDHLLEKVNARIGNVTTKEYSKAIVGSYNSNLDMNDFFKNPPKPQG